jgi:hypothetical protein
VAAPSIWYDAVAVPHTKPGGKGRVISRSFEPLVLMVMRLLVVVEIC